MFTDATIDERVAVSRTFQPNLKRLEWDNGRRRASENWKSVMQIQNIAYRFLALGVSLVLTGLVVIAPHVARTAPHQLQIAALHAGALDERNSAFAGVAAVLRNS